MGGMATQNAVRSGIVVLGFLAFGYLSLELGYKPFLLKAQQEQEALELERSRQQNSSASDDNYSL